MIQIFRGHAPEYLLSDKVQKTKDQLKEQFYTSSRQERLRFDMSILKRIQPDLMRICSNKCAYCESKIGSTGFGDIENFRPKAGARGLNRSDYAPSHYWWLVYEWDNLFMSCQICNQKYKRDNFPLENESFRAPIEARRNELITEQALLIDPGYENPAEHLEFYDDGYVRELTKRGKVTIEIIGLNRIELVENRRKEASHLKDKLEIISFTTDFTNKFTAEFVSYVAELFSDHPSQQFAALQRRIFDDWYEQHSGLWENIKLQNKENSKTFIRKKPGTLKENVEEVSAQLDLLKRFSIKSVLIENFKSIEKLLLEIPELNKSTEQESWLLLLGDNGIGKSSILQAITLALISKVQLNKLELDVSDYLKRGTLQGRVVISSYEHDTPVTLLFDKDGFHTTQQEAPSFIMAYGSTRLLPKGNIQSDHNKEPYQNVRNLFDYSVSLNDPGIWLGQINPDEFKDKIAPAFFDALALRKNDRLYVKEAKIRIAQFGEEFELEDNSDGYKTITALVADIMQTLSVDSASYHNAQGIVLIDEIGNHLHPRWRMKIAGALRKAFPRLQFIVTTHEPLCLRGLSYGEVVVMVRDAKNKVRAIDKALLPDHTLLRIDQLLTSDLFGLINVLDDETEKNYEDYHALLSKKEVDRTVEEKEKLQVYTEQLADKELLGSSPQLQALYELVNQEYANVLREEGFKTKSQLKESTIENVKAIIGNKKFNWL